MSDLREHITLAGGFLLVMAVQPFPSFIRWAGIAIALIWTWNIAFDEGRRRSAAPTREEPTP